MSASWSRERSFCAPGRHRTGSTRARSSSGPVPNWPASTRYRLQTGPRQPPSPGPQSSFRGPPGGLPLLHPLGPKAAPWLLRPQNRPPAAPPHEPARPSFRIVSSSPFSSVRVQKSVFRNSLALLSVRLLYTRFRHTRSSLRLGPKAPHGAALGRRGEEAVAIRSLLIFDW